MIVCRDGQIIHQYKTSIAVFVPHDLVYLVHEDRKGNRWLCTYKGLECVTGTGVSIVSIVCPEQTNCLAGR